MLPVFNYYISTPIMSEKKNIMSINKRRKKRWPPTLFTRGGGGGREGGEDELATVKAAAWAWYQRNEGKPTIREFDLAARAIRTPRPSRYKLEANKSIILSENWDLKSHSNHLLNADQETKFSSLLDSYEIKSISKRIDESSLPTNSLSRHDTDLHYDHVSLQMKTECDSKENGLVTKMRKRNLWKGILMTPKTVCGRNDDVVLGAYRVAPKTQKVAPTSADIRTGGR